jgi:hypothetical protein
MSTADEDGLPPLSPEEEATMQAEIDLALEPYKKLAPAKLLPVLRESLERALRTHPVPRQLLKAFAPKRVDTVSGDRPVGGAAPEPRDKVGGKEGA